jgi:tRNA(Ile)-lysidine synthase
MFSQGGVTGVAVSGGRDSVCLLDVLAELAPSLGLRLEVLHVNHRLRQEADEEEAFVRGLAESRGLPVHVARPELDTGNLEAAARAARLRFFAEAPVAAVATGHTRSDQAETVLFRILRGTGVTGLAAIRPVAGKLVRPLLSISRREVDAWVTARGLAFREDSSNADIRFDRNRIRHRLLPMLEQEWNPAVEEALARLADIAREEEDAWADMTGTGSGAIASVDTVNSQPRAVRRRLVRAMAERAAGVQLTFEQLDRVLQLFERDSGDGRAIIGELDVLRSLDRVRFSRRTVGQSRNWSVTVPFPADERSPFGRLRVWWSLNPAYNEGAGIGLLAGKSFVLRNWRPGDEIELAGRGRSLRLKELFQEGRVPLWERRDWPVLTLSDEVVWTKRWGRAKPWHGSRLRIRFQANESESL